MAYVEPKDCDGVVYRRAKEWLGGDGCVVPRPKRPLVPSAEPRSADIPPLFLNFGGRSRHEDDVDDEASVREVGTSRPGKKRQELAASPAPYSDFPFPGHLAVDRLYWLRQEFENANDAEASALRSNSLIGPICSATRPRRFAGSQFSPENLVDSLMTKPLLRADV